MSESPFSSQASSTLPATQYNERTPSRSTTLWTSSSSSNTYRALPSSQKRRSVRLFEDEEEIEDEAPKRIDNAEPPPPLPAEASTPRRADWKRPTFARASGAERRMRSQLSTLAHDEQDDASDRQPFVAPTLTAQQWRVPLQRRVEETSASQARLRLAAALEAADMDAVDRGIANVEARDEELIAYDEDGLPRLHDTDDSEQEEHDGDDESVDAWEMRDHLRHRLRSGFAQLDQRLGLEARHAAAAQLDDSIGNGLTSGGLLEVTGTPGSGKTTLLMQLAVKERLQALEQAATSLHGDGGQDDGCSVAAAARQVVIIDTEGSVSAHRLARMALALIEEATAEWDKQDNSATQRRPSCDALLEHTLAGIYITRCTTLGQLLATFEVLLPSSSENVRIPTDDNPVRRVGLPDDTSLIVIDSITHYFRAPPSNELSKRLEQMHALSCAQRFAARAHAAAIKLVVAKQMNSSFLTSDGQRTNARDANALVTMKPMLLDWLDPATAADAWCLLLYRVDMMSIDRAALIVARPASLRDGRDGGIVSDEQYWQMVMAYRIDERGIMTDSPSAKRQDCTTTT